MASRGLFRNPFRVNTAPRRRTTSHLNEGDCPYQQRSRVNYSTLGNQGNKSQCLCCFKKFSFMERILSLGQKRCQQCRILVCKRCSNLNPPGQLQCHLCQVKNHWKDRLTPQHMLNMEERELKNILRSLHQRDRELENLSKPELIKRIFTRLQIHNDWEPNTITQSNSDSSPQRQKRRPSREEAEEAKRSKTSSQEDLRTIDLIDVINNDIQKPKKIDDEDDNGNVSPVVIEHTSTSNARVSAPRTRASSTAVRTSSSRPQSSGQQQRSQRRRRKNSSLTPQNFAASLRKSVIKGASQNSHRRAPIQKRGSACSLPIEDLCKICMDTTPNCVFLNCGHMVSCHKCAHLVQECPICRSKIVKVQKVYKS